MYLVAVHRLEGEQNERISALAEALSMTVYEARQRLVATPAIVIRTATAQDAKERASRLRAAGFRLLEFNPPKYTHVMLGGRIVETGDAALAHDLHANGYATVRERHPEAHSLQP